MDTTTHPQRFTHSATVACPDCLQRIEFPLRAWTGEQILLVALTTTYIYHDCPARPLTGCVETEPHHHHKPTGLKPYYSMCPIPGAVDRGMRKRCDSPAYVQLGRDA